MIPLRVQIIRMTEDSYARILQRYPHRGNCFLVSVNEPWR
jgi:hypothetical protein